ncbi:putative prolyl 4-hydroxylase 9 [Vitis vinifera]|uniref:Putative prolyl 4-hydroxylase 9 n=1 Tax=Vitis vinifera TaxID=29760 RepID=A0A438FBU0_VITVI|nr:putative prolyl 4-hydroxylase 9 [Vitis vinifera]
MKSKAKGKWRFGTKLGLPVVFLFCLFFFLAGLFGSGLLPQEFSSSEPRRLIREETDYDPLAHGESGEDSVTSIPFQVLSWRPRALYFPNFATSEQCQSIINMAKSNLTPSTVALRVGEIRGNTEGIRTSSGVFISASEDKTGTLDLIEQKIARVIMIPRTHGEIKPKENCLNWLVMKRFLTDVVYHVAFNVLRYEIGQRYNSHYDAFDPAEYGPQRATGSKFQFLTFGKEQVSFAIEIATFLVYLSDVEEGGETMFPFENGLNMDKDYDFQRCIGLKVKPHQGDGLLFYSMFPNGTIDPTSLHGSCPVIKGEKWVATKWIRDQEQDD